jgi:FixJ family two-component response regulator
MSHATPIVFVVDDDVSVRESLELLIRCAGWQPETFASAQAFLARPRVLVPSCLVLDVNLPGLNGLDLQQRVATERSDMPIIFITGYGDVPMTVQAMKAGAVEFLTKPFGDDVLLHAIPARLRAQPHGTWSRGGDTATPGRVRVTQPARTRGHGVGGLRPVE